MQDSFIKRPLIRITFVVIAVAAAAIVVTGEIVRSAAERKLREAILAELQPVALKNCTLKRFGSANDGGYLMCENLIEPLDAGYSYGVSRGATSASAGSIHCIRFASVRGVTTSFSGASGAAI